MTQLCDVVLRSPEAKFVRRDIDLGALVTVPLDDACWHETDLAVTTNDRGNGVLNRSPSINRVTCETDRDHSCHGAGSVSPIDGSGT